MATCRIDHLIWDHMGVRACSVPMARSLMEIDRVVPREWSPMPPIPLTIPRYPAVVSAARSPAVVGVAGSVRGALDGSSSMSPSLCLRFSSRRVVEHTSSVLGGQPRPFRKK